MKTFDSLLESPQADIPLHPRLRNWRERLTQPGVEAELELHRPVTALGLAQTQMMLHFTEGGQPQPIEETAWDDDLNTGLIDLGVRSVNPEEEAKRFALGLRATLQKAAREYGDGYLNAMLVDLFTESDLVRYPEIAEVLEYSAALPFDRQARSSRSYNACREMVADAIAARMNELQARRRNLKDSIRQDGRDSLNSRGAESNDRYGLGYAHEDAKRILVKAIAQYLDERFSVSSRRRLGLL